MGEYIKLYFQWHIILLAFLALSIIILATDLGIEKKAKAKLASIIGIIFLLSIVHTIERYVCEETNDYPNFRFVLTVIKYIGPQLILCLLITTLSNNKRINISLYSLLGIEFILLATSQFTHLVYYISENNTFTRSYLGILPFAFSLLYLIAFVVIIVIKLKSERFELVFLLASALLCVVITILEALDIISAQLNTALGSAILFYEIYLFYVNSKKDFLTGLLNRKSFVNDLKNNDDKLSALISMDLNGLKTINDSYGHQAGDDFIVASAKAFTSVKGYKYKVYRVGGDEFNAIVFNAKEDNIKKMIEIMNDNITKANYSVSFGYVMNDKKYSVDDLIKLADEVMYESKKKYYQNSDYKRNIFVDNE